MFYKCNIVIVYSLTPSHNTKIAYIYVVFCARNVFFLCLNHDAGHVVFVFSGKAELF